MDTNASSRLLKGFLGAILATILIVAGFGVGLSVGANRAQPEAAASTMESLGAPEESAANDPRPPLASPTPKASAVPVEVTPGPTSDPLDSELFGEAWSLLKDQFYGELPEGQDLTYNAIRGVVDRLGDEHTAFVDPEHAAMFNSDMEGSFEGIGARVDLAEGGGVELKYLFEEQPAQKAGLRIGDVIVEVDGSDVTHIDLTEAITLIRGPRDSKVTLTIRREGEEDPLKVVVTRARIEIPVIEAKTLGGGKIEYIALSEFSSIAPQKLSDAVRAALDKNPSGLILDLRGNPGGLLDASVRVASYFVPEGNILIERFKDGDERLYKRQGRYLLGKTPMVVLVDGGSASASEIVAGAVQDAGTGVLIGEQTYGKGSVQIPNTLSDGSQLRVTVARWFTPKDRGIHEVGLAPDIEVKRTTEDMTAGRDPQLDRAIQYLTTGK